MKVAGGCGACHGPLPCHRARLAGGGCRKPLPDRLDHASVLHLVWLSKPRFVSVPGVSPGTSRLCREIWSLPGWLAACSVRPRDRGSVAVPVGSGSPRACRSAVALGALTGPSYCRPGHLRWGGKPARKGKRQLTSSLRPSPSCVRIGSDPSERTRGNRPETRAARTPIAQFLGASPANSDDELLGVHRRGGKGVISQNRVSRDGPEQGSSIHREGKYVVNAGIELAKLSADGQIAHRPGLKSR